VRSVLILEADQQVLRERGDQLLMDDYDVHAASSGPEARAKLAEHPDALLLSNAGSAPETIALLRELRAGEIEHADPALPVLVLGADDDSSAVRYYGAGADLALPSQAAPLLVTAGLRALARRAGTDRQRRQVIRVGSLTVDRESRTAEVSNRPVRLTRLEFDMLATLASEPRKAFSRAEITREVWGYDPQLAGPSRTLNTHASRLRHKLEEAGAPPMVQSVRGIGWRLTG
jgi:DNA-binding response OmpR family regulator